MVEKIINSKFIWEVKTDVKQYSVTADNLGDFDTKVWELFDQIQGDKLRNSKKGSKTE